MCIRDSFQTYDSDKNGVLSKDEFRNAMRACNIFASQSAGGTEPLNDEDIDRIFAAVDVNGDGQISFTEFLAATLDPRDYDIHSLNTAFQLLDVDQKGESHCDCPSLTPHSLLPLSTSSSLCFSPGYITAADMERVLSVTVAARKRSIMSQHSQNNLLQTARGQASNAELIPPHEEDVSQCSRSLDDKPQGRKRSASLGPVRRSSLLKDILPMLTGPRRASTSKISPEFVLQSVSGEDEFTNSQEKKKRSSKASLPILSTKSNSSKSVAPYVLPGETV